MNDADSCVAASAAADVCCPATFGGPFSTLGSPARWSGRCNVQVRIRISPASDVPLRRALRRHSPSPMAEKATPASFEIYRKLQSRRFSA